MDKSKEHIYREATIDDLIKDLVSIHMREEVSFGYQLHQGIRNLICAFDSPKAAADFLLKYRTERFEI